jgi:hypothetical protein
VVFERGHGKIEGDKNADGVWIPRESGESWILWSPPPALADIAVDELNVTMCSFALV